ncbi:hypothetical protein HDU84_005113 [Entophlyctis sp. JEL0112]|nr:hypothetical protein HDU84_005113 [Entophlyctis sp. JEL0112]
MEPPPPPLASGVATLEPSSAKDSARDEKLRAARRKLGKYQRAKNKTSTPPLQIPPVAASFGHDLGHATPSDPPQVFIPTIPPGPAHSNIPLPVRDRLPSPSRNQPQTGETLTQSNIDPASEPRQTQERVGVAQQQPQKRSMFNSFVSAVTTTAASIINPDSDLITTDDQLAEARKQLQIARQERLSRSRSRSPTAATAITTRRSQDISPSRIASNGSPSRPDSFGNKNFGDVGNLFGGMAAKLFSGVSRSMNTAQVPQNLPEANSSEFSYGIQDGRDFNIDPHPPADVYAQSYEYQEQPQNVYDDRSYTAYPYDGGNYSSVFANGTGHVPVYPPGNPEYFENANNGSRIDPNASRLYAQENQYAGHYYSDPTVQTPGFYSEVRNILVSRIESYHTPAKALQPQTYPSDYSTTNLRSQSPRDTHQFQSEDNWLNHGDESQHKAYHQENVHHEPIPGFEINYGAVPSPFDDFGRQINQPPEQEFGGNIMNSNGGGLQTWPTSASQIESISRRASANQLVTGVGNLSPSLQRRSRRNSGLSASFAPNGNHSADQQNVVSSELGQGDVSIPYFSSRLATVPRENVQDAIAAENEMLLQKLATLEAHLENAVAARIDLEQQVFILQTERDTAEQAVSELRKTVVAFGTVNERALAIDALQKEVLEREEVLSFREQSLDNREAAIVARENSQSVSQSGGADIDSRMRLRIAEIEESRAALDARESHVRAREVEADQKWDRAVQLKTDSEEALRKIEGSAARLRDMEVTINEQQAALERARAAFEKDVQAWTETKLRETDERKQIDQERESFLADRAVLASDIKAHNALQRGLDEYRRTLDAETERLHNDKDALRAREAEVRAREDEFLAESSGKANREAAQLAELRKAYDEDSVRLQAALIDIQERELRVTETSDELFRLSEQLNEERARLERASAELEAERADFAQQVAEFQQTQSLLVNQQKALDEAASSFSEMKDYIDQSMKENEIRIRSEFESLQQAHNDLKDREEQSLRDIERDRKTIYELQLGLEKERQLLEEKERLMKNASALETDSLAKVEHLEKHNQELAAKIKDLNDARKEDESQIEMLEESNRQLQSNVLRLTQIIDSGSARRSTSLRSLTPSAIARESQTKMEFPEEDGSLKEAAATIVSTFNDFKKLLSDTAEEIRGRKVVTPTQNDRNHRWTKREAEILKNAAAGKNLTQNDVDLFAGKSSHDLLNVIIALTSTNQNLSRKLDETLDQVRSLQLQSHSAKNSGRRSSVGGAASDVADTVSSTGAVGVHSLRSDDYYSSAGTILSQTDAGNGYYASTETVSNYDEPDVELAEKPAPLYPAARSMKKVDHNLNSRKENGYYSLSEVSEYAEPITKHRPNISRPTPSSLPMARILSTGDGHDQDDPESPVTSPATPKSNFGKRATAPAGYYSLALPSRKLGDPVARLSNGYTGYSNGAGLRKQPYRAATATGYSHPQSHSSRAEPGVLTHRASTDGLRSYISDRDADTIRSPTRKAPLVRPQSATPTGGWHVEQRALVSESVGGRAARKDVSFAADRDASRAKSDTEGVSAWSAGAGSGRNLLAGTASRSESIRDAIRARIKERDMKQF